MKKIFYLLLVVGMALCFAACDEDRDSNPTLQEAPTFVLNTPSFAANNVYDLLNSDYVLLTTSQPDYGFPASTVYTVWVSLDSVNFTPLSTTSTTAKIQAPASEFNQAILDQAGNRDLSSPVPVYVKLTAHIYGNEDLGVSESNVVKLPYVQTYIPAATAPTTMYIVGGFPASDSWSKFVPLHDVYSTEGWFYGVVYLPEGAEFKVNPDAGWQGNDKGFGQVTAEDNANAGFQSADSSNDAANMKVTNGGWYTVIVKVKLVNGAVDYTVSLNEAKVYVIGAAEGGNWSAMDEWRFVAPDDANGDWVSPAFAGSGELRMFIDCGTDWWKTEFTIKSDGTLFYRNVDIPGSWGGDVGPDYSQDVSAGQKAYLNFTTGTGSVK